MSTLKAHFDTAQAQALIATLGYSDSHIEALSGGESSRAYAFTTKTGSLVLRVNHHAPYDIDSSLSNFLQDSEVPVPPVLQTGTNEGRFWAISERSPGFLVEDLDLPRHLALRNDLVATMIAIHDTPLNDITGFGWLDADLHGHCTSWRQFLEADGIYGTFVDWDRAFGRASERQRNLIGDAWQLARDMFDCCPEQRCLNHGDYTYNNLLTDGAHITGVIDWSNALVGDPLWDVAWTDVWTPGLGLARAYLKERPANQSAERILCYQLLIAAAAIGFYIHTEQPGVNTWVEEQLRERIERARTSAGSRRDE